MEQKPSPAYSEASPIVFSGSYSRESVGCNLCTHFPGSKSYWTQWCLLLSRPKLSLGSDFPGRAPKTAVSACAPKALGKRNPLNAKGTTLCACKNRHAHAHSPAAPCPLPPSLPPQARASFPRRRQAARGKQPSPERPHRPLPGIASRAPRATIASCGREREEEEEAGLPALCDASGCWGLNAPAVISDGMRRDGAPVVQVGKGGRGS